MSVVVGCCVHCCSKLLHEAETPNWLLVQSGLEDHETPLQQALVEFATQGSLPAAGAGGGTPPAAAAAAADTAAAARSNGGDTKEAAGQGGAAASAGPAAAGGAAAQKASRQQCYLREGESLLSGALSIALCCALMPKP
ncbi:hypothetical protein Emed_005163 [Eimeria media]